MKFRPLHDRVVVERIDADAKSAGGILIPDSAQEKPSQGEIVAVGPGGRDEAGKLIPIDLKKGDRVLFGKWSGTEVEIDGEDLLIMKESTSWACCRRRSPRRRPLERSHHRNKLRSSKMSAKEVKFSVDARDRMLRGIDILNNAVKVTLGPKATMWCSTSLTEHPASPKTALPSPRRSSSKINSRTWVRRWCVKSRLGPRTKPAMAPPPRPSSLTSLCAGGRQSGRRRHEPDGFEARF